MTGTHALRAALSAALAASPRTKLLGEAVELSPATQGLSAQHPGQVIQLPAADSALVGVAMGMAMNGDAVVVELAGPDSIPAALSALEGGSPCREAPLTVVLRVPLPPGHRLDQRALPGHGAPVHVVAVGQPADAAALLDGALTSHLPTLLIEPLDVLGAPVTDSAAVGFSHARLLRTGGHATVLAWGPGVPAALSAADALTEEGISIDVVDLRHLHGATCGLLAERVRHTGRAIVASPAGLAPALQPLVLGAFLRLESPPSHALPVATDIADRVRDALRY